MADTGRAMTISRRGFIAGLALTGAAVPAAYYAHRQLTLPDEPITPGEATVDLPDMAGQQMANALRGVWDIRLEGRDAGLDGVPGEGLELLLDIAARGRGVRGYLDSAQGLRSDAVPRYEVLGDLADVKQGQISWRLLDSRSGIIRYQFVSTLDEVWAAFGNAGTASLSGRVLRMDRALGLPEDDNRFVAIKRLFPEARERALLNPTLEAWLISPEHRLFHQLWHASRDKWHKLPEDKREALRGSAGNPALVTVSVMLAGHARTAMARASTSFSCTGICWARRVRCRICRPGRAFRCRSQSLSAIAWGLSVTSIITMAFRCRRPGFPGG